MKRPQEGDVLHTQGTHGIVPIVEVGNNIHDSETGKTGWEVSSDNCSYDCFWNEKRQRWQYFADENTSDN